MIIEENDISVYHAIDNEQRNEEDLLTDQDSATNVEEGGITYPVKVTKRECERHMT